ncbi:MAG: AMP-binding protein [Clostridia bacterium]|nr:AMP-binding protein [Clostridia bacterium]
MEDKKRKLYKGRTLNNFKELIERYENEYSEKIAFTYKENPKSKDFINISYSKFASDIKSLATSLIHLGLSKKRVAIIASNRYEWCVSYLAITTSDIVVVPLDKSLPDNEIESLIKRSEVEAIIFDKKHIDVLKNLKASNTTNLKHLICMDNTEDKDVINYSILVSKGNYLLENDDQKYQNIKLDNDKISIMLFTSGTTAISKAVMLSQANICADIYALSQMTDIRREDIFLSFLPLHHTFESTCTFLYGTSCGITVAFSDGLRYVANNLKEFNITGFVSVPLMLEIMYKKIDKAIEEQGKKKLVKTMSSVCNFLLKFGIDIRRKVFKTILNSFAPNLRVLIAGGAPMSKDAIECFVNLGINLLQGYGLTETSPVLAGENDKYKKAGSVGFALPGITIEIDNSNDEGIGEIKAKGPTIMKGYYENEEATNEVLKDGWFYTGDLGYIDKEGYLFITGRKKDVIVLKNGKNIYPEELEILINKLPYVAESLVFGMPDSKKDDLVLSAKIVYNKDVIEEMFKDKKVNEYHDIIWQDIKAQINKQLPAYKSIKDIIVTNEPLIKTTTQKIKRHEEIRRILGN